MLALRHARLHAKLQGFCCLPKNYLRLWFSLSVTHHHKQGAQLLLRNAQPITLQVDALISLVAAYGPLRLYWTTEAVVHDTPWRRSRVWDGCILHCIVPDVILPALIALIALAALCCLRSRLK